MTLWYKEIIPKFGLDNLTTSYSKWLFKCEFFWGSWEKSHLQGKKYCIEYFFFFEWSFMNRLNSGIFRIFELREWNLNLNSSDCRASKIIYNDTKLEPIPWEQTRENSLLNFCVGVSVRGHDGTKFFHISKDAQ